MTPNVLRRMIKTFDHPALRAVCEPLQREDDITFLYTMREVLKATKNGAGLAAPQIGVLKRACYLWPERHTKAVFMINPEIVERSPDTAQGQEGCLSYPDVYTLVMRHVDVRITYFDEFWRPQDRWFYGFSARVAQHEIDHLNAICHVGDVWRKKG